ncbi:hypothetical protein [Acidisoma sp. L85]|uniref:hypothetical protein n=1 Tax=Acidisoma sp. L85 TaxID=1641850 RepID=UPI00131C8583|nr:hypothetical protein [Acidisoma sp. L85]
MTPPASAPAAGHFDQGQYRSLLRGMFAQGHGIEALCFFLAVTREALFDLVVQFNLPTPNDRPLRRSGGARAWKQTDFTVLLDGWLNNWSAACIADRLGRSRGSIWYQARRLGLPKRERRSLHWPDQPRAQPFPTPNIGSERKRLPARWFVKGTDKKLELTSKRNGLEVDWAANVEAFVDIGWRVWSGQRISRIAEDYGVSYRTITSQVWWLQAVFPKGHKNTRDDFDRALGEANARAAGAELKKCLTNSTFPFWKTRNKRQSKRDKRNGIGAGLDY